MPNQSTEGHDFGADCPVCGGTCYRLIDIAPQLYAAARAALPWMGYAVEFANQHGLDDFAEVVAASTNLAAALKGEAL